MNKTLSRVAKGLAKSLSVPLLLVLIAPLSSANATVAADMQQAGKQGGQMHVTEVRRESTKKVVVVKKRRVASKKSFKRKSVAVSQMQRSAQAKAGVVLKTSPVLTVAVASPVIANPVPLQQDPWQYMPPSSVPVPVIAAALPTQQVQPVRINPYLVNMPVPGQAAVAEQTQKQAAASAFAMPKFSLPDFSLPQLPLFQEEILPKVSKVYPTGEKPLVVVSFKCPTELIGIDTPSTKLLHMGIEGGMDLVNKTNLLSFNMQSVCR